VTILRYVQYILMEIKEKYPGESVMDAGDLKKETAEK
jgi:hypothetical protein